MCLICLINAEEDNSQDNISSVPTVQWPQSVEYHELAGEDFAIHYFAIGSMTNDVSLSLRDLRPITSRPAILPGHRLLFRGSAGMATVEEIDNFEPVEHDAPDYPFDCVHGVLHLLTKEHMKLLDRFEGGYSRNICKVKLYCGTEVDAVVYQIGKSVHPYSHMYPPIRPYTSIYLYIPLHTPIYPYIPLYTLIYPYIPL